LIVDISDAADITELNGEVAVSALDTRLSEADAAERFCEEVLAL
jgi:hypothetical protein